MMIDRQKIYELNLDGLIGPTHHYAGLAYGNKASMAHAHTPSNPAKAALEGLQKIRLLHSLGIKQAILPPQLRPNLKFLHQLGFTGSVANQLERAKKQNPRALSAAFSASSMWAANSATVTPSIDASDKRVHFTAANLVHHLHRHQEADASQAILKQIFSDATYFLHHEILPKTPGYNDEGAANHNRLAAHHGAMGFNLFVYGQGCNQNASTRYPARQTYDASAAIARKHQLKPDRTFFIAQHPKAIDAGVFHNDVISLANESVFLVHETAFVDQKNMLQHIKKQSDFKLNLIEISEKQLSLDEAVRSYFFNAQLITLPDTSNMALIAPMECKDSPRACQLINELILNQHNPITAVHYVALKQSMQNGGGPACLRLRVPLTERELNAMHQGVLITNPLLDVLEDFVTQHYRETLCFDDLVDPMLVEEALSAHDALMKIMGLNSK